MIDLIFRGLQVIGLIVVIGAFALIYMSIQRENEREREKFDNEMFKMLKGRNTDSPNETTRGNSIRGCHSSDNGERD